MCKYNKWPRLNAHRSSLRYLALIILTTLLLIIEMCVYALAGIFCYLEKVAMEIHTLSNFQRIIQSL